MTILVELWLESTTEMKADMQSESEELELRKEKYRQYLKTLFDGQRFYIGKSISEAHCGLAISNERFTEALGELSNCLKQIRPD